MKTYLLAALMLLPAAAHAQGALFQKEITVSPEEFARRGPPPADPSALIAELTWQVLEASNRERAFAGLSPLSPDPALDAAAARYSRKMRDFNFFDHVAPDGESLDDRLPEAERWRYQGLGENLWSGQGALDWRASALATEAAANWVESPGHRENILDPDYTLGGIGAAMRGDQLYITMLYATPFADQQQAVLRRDHGNAPSDLRSFISGLETALVASLNAERAQTGTGPMGVDAALAQTARSHAGTMMATGLGGSGVLEQALAADPSRTGRLAAGLWQGSGALVWQAEAMAAEIVSRWRGGQTWTDATDPGFDDVGVGVASDGTRLMVTVIFGESAGL